MAWPLTPLTTYLAGLPPAIKAFDLNAIQTTINSILTGAITLKAVSVDSTGGALSAPQAGTLRATGSVASTTFPNPLAYPFGGIVGVGSAPLGWVSVESTGNLLKGYNIASGPGVVRTGVGVYEILFYAQPSTANACPVVTPSSFGAVFKAVPSLVGLQLKVTVSTYNPVTGAATDCGFSLLVLGE